MTNLGFPEFSRKKVKMLRINLLKDRKRGIVCG
jgi:hypothetical protein